MTWNLSAVYGSGDVMAEGGVLTEGSVAEVRNNEDVIEAYLGTGLKNR